MSLEREASLLSGSWCCWVTGWREPAGVGDPWEKQPGGLGALVQGVEPMEFQNVLAWSRKETAGAGGGLQMPLGVPIAAGVLGLLALLALVCHCIKEAWKSKWKPNCWGWRGPHPGESLQLVSTHRLETLSPEPGDSQVPSPPSF